MSYQEIRHYSLIARKPHRCIWCGEPIQKGDLHIRIKSKFDGDLQDHRFHGECVDPCHEHCDQSEGEFIPFDNKRGKP